MKASRVQFAKDQPGRLKPIPGIELSKQVRRRILKAERDERIDLTTMLTPVKTFMGGFTRPKDLRIGNWLAGGAYLARNKSYEPPTEAAYEPHTVFLLESRYNIKFGIGRTETLDHIVGICRSADLEAVLKRFNSKRAPLDAIESMDNARWPWLPQKPLKKESRPSWWSTKDELSASLNNESENMMKEPILSPIADNNLAKPSARERPERPEDKLRQTAAVLHRVKEANLEGVNSDMRRLEGKIPFEVEHADGGTYHPSGFKVPTSVADFARHSPQPDTTIRSNRFSEPRNPDAAIDQAQWKAIQEKKGHLMADLTADVISGEISAQTVPRNAKIPTEIAGILDSGEVQPPQHASGFIPPTPAMARGETEAHTHTVEEEVSPEDIQAYQDHAKELSYLRQHYFEHIKTEPFWRPLLALSVSTRPLGATLSRLSRGLARGIPFYSVVESDGRKSLTTFGHRMRNMRLERMHELAVSLAEILAGARGGPIGVRFQMNDAGRGIDGEGLDAPIPWEKRVLGVAVGEWYDRADEVKEIYRISAEENVRKYEAMPDPEHPPFLIYSMNERGMSVPPELKETFPWMKDGEQSVSLDPKMQEVVDEVHFLKELLTEEGENGQGHDLHLWVPKKEPGASEPPPVRRARQGEDPPPGHLYVRHTQARAVVKSRQNYVHELYAEDLARIFSTRANHVVYP